MFPRSIRISSCAQQISNGRSKAEGISGVVVDVRAARIDLLNGENRRGSVKRGNIGNVEGVRIRAVDNQMSDNFVVFLDLVAVSGQRAVVNGKSA